jgi:putative ABC transport system substrate-binding protein
MSYGENLKASYRAAATYMDKIKKGINPAVLPVQQPTHFEMVLNANRAKALGIEIPEPVLLWADEVIP